MAKAEDRIVRRFCVIGLALATTTLPGGAASAEDTAATAGIAYDTVLKLVSTPDPPLRAGDFAVDFQAGLTPNAGCNPHVVHRYMTAERERIEDVCKQDATIVDCATRTVTVLDLQHKPYGRTSLDMTYDDGITEIRALNDQVRSTLTLGIERSAHGKRTIGEVVTAEFANV